MPLTNLCSRLIVTGIRKPPSSRAWSLHSADPRDHHRASDPARLYRTRHEPSTKTRASRCRRHLPRAVSRIGADFTGCGPGSLLLLGMPGHPGMTHTGVVNPCASRDSKTTDVSLRPPRNPGCPEPARIARALSTRGAPTPQLPRLRNAFHPRILATSPLACAWSGPSRQRTVPELCTPWPAVRHAFTHSFCMLDTPRRDYSSRLDEPHAVYGILQLKAIFEHTHEHAKPQPQQQATSVR
jgi:hypothetical protein